MHRGTCRLECVDDGKRTVVEKEQSNHTHTGEWHLSQSIIDAIRAFDAANPPGKGDSSLADRVKDGLK
jgi:hypothetical protein